jgi:NhaA family Na+:H+ antiporter
MVSPGDSTELLPSRPIERVTTPFRRFLRLESASGAVLLVCTAAAIWMANSGATTAYRTFWDQRLRISLGEMALDHPLQYWVNEGLMTLFFFVIGLEIKRELVGGELGNRRNLVAPLAAALGGAIVPVLIFQAVRAGEAGAAGWAVPMATDIAFVVGALAVLGRRVPRGLHVFVLALAIADDILAVVVIALFYGGDVRVDALGAAVGGLAVVVAMNRLGIRSVAAYALVGAVIWLFTHQSGIHPTIAGVALGLLTPARPWVGSRSMIAVLGRAARAVAGSRDPSPPRAALGTLRFASREAASPLDRLEEGLHPWVAFVVVPLFAFANAGVTLEAQSLTSRVSLSIGAGLVVGKPVGILLATWLVVRRGWTSLPEGTTWPILGAAGCLAGVGFTMSLFVASLGLDGRLLESAKGGILLGSGVALVLGLVLLGAVLPRRDLDPDSAGVEHP